MASVIEEKHRSTLDFCFCVSFREGISKQLAYDSWEVTSCKGARNLTLRQELHHPIQVGKACLTPLSTY